MDALESNRKMRGDTDSDEQIKPSKRFKFSESMNPGNDGCTVSSPPAMELSQPPSVDYVGLSPPMDAIESMRELQYGKIDPDEQVKPSKSLKSSESMNPGQHDSTASSTPTMKPFEGKKSRLWWATTVAAQRDVFLSHSGRQKNFVRQLHQDLIREDVSCFFDEDENSLPLAHKFPPLIFNAAETCKIAVVVLSKDFVSSKWPMLELSAFVKAKYSGKNSKLKLLSIFFKISPRELFDITKDSLEWKEFAESNQTRDEWQAALKEVLSIEGLQLSEDGNEVDCRDKAVKEIYCFLKGINHPKLFGFERAAQLKKSNQQLGDLMDSHQSSLQLVFLCHSGREKNFIRQLHRDLTRENVSCFFEEVENSLSLAHKAAETCEIAVVVLSKEFVSSKWPMLELSAMHSRKNSKLKLLPIFFKISPRELAQITQESREWKEFAERNGTRDEWQASLKAVRSIKGLQLGEDGNEVDCRGKAVKAICCFLKGINPPKLLEFEPVGIEDQVREVKTLLDMEGPQSALAVIVCGFGGVGKSTLAASVVQSLDWSSTDFKFCRVAIDEKTPDKISHIVKLQKDIIYNLGGVKLDLQDPLDGRFKIKEVLQNKCSLLFIDNVVDKDYIGDLLPKDLSSGEKDLKLDAEKQKTKLRILITSREANVKAEVNINCEVHEVRTLSKPVTQRLLFETIVQGNVVEDKDFDEEGMINQVADACRGVPLLLSIFGKHLRTERDKDNYQDALEALRNGDPDSYRDEDLGTKLMFVYNKIGNVEVKDAFLDICTYFHGWEWNIVADIVDSSKLRDLRSRMLVSRSGSGEVVVHDILRLMGMKEARFTRFSNYEELEDNLDGFGNVKGISLVNDNHTIQSTQLEAMRLSLRVLMLGDWVTLDGTPCQKTFTNLRYLRVGDICVFPFKDPSKLNKLRVFVNSSKPGMNLFRLPSSLKRISHEVPDVECDKFVKLQFQNLCSLKSFIVKPRKSVELSEEFHLPASLVDLDLNRCKNLPKYIGHLTALESLILDRCDLKWLPQGFGNLKKLKHLSMDYCSELTSLSEELGTLSSLEAVSMKNCGNLKALPMSLGGLLSLQTLELEGSINLQLLPESFGELRIHSLQLHSLEKLNDLPNSFGNMPLLKDLSLKSCHSLMSLPSSFVQLKMLETLKIIQCSKLRVLPEEFGRLRCLKNMTLEECHLLKELPHGFGALPALKTFILRRCNSFVDLPRDFTELTCLEELDLVSLPLISSIADGLSKLKKLRVLRAWSCFQLKTFSDDFEKMATLDRLYIARCPNVDGTMMEKILKLQQCFKAHIAGSRKLLEKWEHMQGQTEHQIAVNSGQSRVDIRERGRALRVALLRGKCMEVNIATDQLTERSSLLKGLEGDVTASVALIMLPHHLQSHQHRTLKQFVERAREAAKTNGSGKLQIVCARKFDLYVQIPTATEEEERAEEEGIRQIVVSLPKGSCAIPSAETKRLKILTWCCDFFLNRPDELSFVMADVVINIEGRSSFENLIFTKQNDISKSVGMKPSPSEIKKAESKHYNSIQNFIKSICAEEERGADEQSQSQAVAGESKTREFVEALKGNGIDHLLIRSNTSKVEVDDLQEKSIGFIICHFNFVECIKLQQIYKDLQHKDSNFIAIWIPAQRLEDCGHGTYTRLIQCMPWATFPHPQLLNVDIRRPRFVVLDKHGQIANHDALPLILAWGEKCYPFTRHTIPESFSLMESESCLELLLHGMNIVGRKAMKSKMTFLYAQRPSECQSTEFRLEELTQIHGSFEVLYVGKLNEKFSDTNIFDIKSLNKEYEDATQNMHWPSLSFSDMIMFWYRCHYLASKKGYPFNTESNITMEALHGLAKQLESDSTLVLVDKDGLVTRGGHDVVQMICEVSDDMSVVKEEVMKSMSRGECTPLVRTVLRDEIPNHPQHPQHRITMYSTPAYCRCDVCKMSIGDNGGRSYRCRTCYWDMCGRCWMAYTKQQVEQLQPAKYI